MASPLSRVQLIAPPSPPPPPPPPPAPRRPLERAIGTTHGSVTALDTLSTACLECKQEVNGPHLTLGYPYHGVLHAQCAPYFPFDGRYPHDHPLSVYQARAFTPHQQ